VVKARLFRPFSHEIRETPVTLNAFAGQRNVSSYPHAFCYTTSSDSAHAHHHRAINCHSVAQWCCPPPCCLCVAHPMTIHPARPNATSAAHGCSAGSADSPVAGWLAGQSGLVTEPPQACKAAIRRRITEAKFKLPVARAQCQLEYQASKNAFQSQPSRTGAGNIVLAEILLNQRQDACVLVEHIGQFLELLGASCSL
jgi:hypothetical protein